MSAQLSVTSAMLGVPPIFEKARALQAELNEMGVGVQPKARRGTTNRNDRGSAEDRRRRREWLVETYRANVDVTELVPHPIFGVQIVALGQGFKACRCYRCGHLHTTETLTVDRIIPGRDGGTYRRNNIRPACSGCNSETGGALAGKGKR